MIAWQRQTVPNTAANTNSSFPVASWEEALDCFLLFKKAQRLAPRTLADHHDHITWFFERTGATLGEATHLRNAVIGYFASSADLAPSTFNTRRKSLNCFFNWAVSEGYMARNPCAGIGRVKEDAMPKAIDEATLRRLLALPDRKTSVGLRDYAFMLLMLDTGIRPREAANLRLKDISLATLSVTIPSFVAKTRVSRTLPILPVTAEAMRRLTASRHHAWSETVPVFCNEDGRELTHNAWARRMSIYSQELGTKVTAYSLRHSFALMYLRRGGDVFSLQKLLGHSTLAMTQRYVALNEADVRERHTESSPINTLMEESHRMSRKAPKSRIPRTSEQGFFYLIQLTPDIDPRRIKVGFASDVDQRLLAHRTASPTACLLNYWRCRRANERRAILTLTKVGCKPISDEVFECEDIEGLVERADAFFASET